MINVIVVKIIEMNLLGFMVFIVSLSMFIIKTQNLINIFVF